MQTIVELKTRILCNSRGYSCWLLADKIAWEDRIPSDYLEVHFQARTEGAQVQWAKFQEDGTMLDCSPAFPCELWDSVNVYIANAFSLQMLDADADWDMSVSKCNRDNIPAGVQSAIGHADTAAVLGFPCNRVNVQLHDGDVLFVAQLQGGRLPEGSTTLPEGFSFSYKRITVRKAL